MSIMCFILNKTQTHKLNSLTRTTSVPCIHAGVVDLNPFSLAKLLLCCSRGYAFIVSIFWRVKNTAHIYQRSHRESHFFPSFSSPFVQLNGHSYFQSCLLLGLSKNIFLPHLFIETYFDAEATFWISWNAWISIVKEFILFLTEFITSDVIKTIDSN